MEKNSTLSHAVAENLLQIKAIKLNAANPFTWASGLKSPIYCDNRKTLSFPTIRDHIKLGFVQMLKDLYPQAEVIAGVATGAIAQGVLVAQELNLPFVYIRSGEKKHGMRNLIEGELQAGAKVVVIEDLVSTGKSSLLAVDALREAGAEVMGMLAIFTYGMKSAQANFSASNCLLHTLSNYPDLLEKALSMGYIGQDEFITLQQWQNHPEAWSQNHQ
jgi:orotate phosphoribosyltransferase